jgi:hypothetical protein
MLKYCFKGILFQLGTMRFTNCSVLKKIGVEKRSGLLFLLEIIWWVFTALIVAGFLFPIWNKTVDYPFWTINIVFIVMAVTVTRYIFLTKFTFIAERKVLKLILIAITIPIIFMLINKLADFQSYLDEIGLDEVLKNLPVAEKEPMFNYIRSEMIFFGTASIIAMIIFPIQMMISIWKNFNR